MVRALQRALATNLYRLRRLVNSPLRVPDAFEEEEEEEEHLP